MTAKGKLTSKRYPSKNMEESNMVEQRELTDCCDDNFNCLSAFVYKPFSMTTLKIDEF